MSEPSNLRWILSDGGVGRIDALTKSAGIPGVIILFSLSAVVLAKVIFMFMCCPSRRASRFPIVLSHHLRHLRRWVSVHGGDTRNQHNVRLPRRGLGMGELCSAAQWMNEPGVLLNYNWSKKDFENKTQQILANVQQKTSEDKQLTWKHSQVVSV